MVSASSPFRVRRPHALLAAGIAGLMMLGGCATDGYGYGGVDVGYGSGYGYGAPYSGGYPYGYGPYGYGGWYDGWYYPGGGYYVYDRDGRRQRWNDRQRGYWEARRREHRGDGPRWNGGRPDGNPGDGRWSGRPRSDGGDRNWNNPPPRAPDGDGRGWNGRWQRNGGAPNNAVTPQATPPQAAPRPSAPSATPQQRWQRSGQSDSPAPRRGERGRR